MLAILKQKRVHHKLITYKRKNSKTGKVTESSYEERNPVIKLVQLGEKGNSRVILPNTFDTIDDAKRYARENYGCSPSKIIEE